MFSLSITKCESQLFIHLQIVDVIFKLKSKQKISYQTGSES